MHVCMYICIYIKSYWVHTPYKIPTSNFDVCLLVLDDITRLTIKGF